MMSNVNKDNTRPFKVAFQNVRTLNNNKLATIVQQLQHGDIFFLNEVNHEEFIFPNSDSYFFHHDPVAYRICTIASKMLDIKPVGRGILLTQERTQADKNAVQSYVYKIRIKQITFHIESFYCIPSLTKNNLDKLLEHLEIQAEKLPNYCCGGDFNLNFHDKSIVNKFKNCNSLKQRINKFTRVQDYTVTNKDGQVRTRTSKTIIDLIFTNPGMDNYYKSSTPIEIEPNSLSTFHTRHMPFDHKCVTICFSLPIKHYYKKVSYFKNPNDRPVPTKAQVKTLNKKINEIDTSEITNYDSLMPKIRNIVDEIIPTNPMGASERMHYRFPIPFSLKKDIQQKKFLDRHKHKTNEDYEKYRVVRNRVKVGCDKAAKDYYNSIFKKAKDVSTISDTLNYIQKNKITNIKGNPDKFEVQGKSGIELANGLAEFMKGRAENLVTDEEVLNAGLPPPPLRDDESIPNQLDISLPHFDNLSKFIPTNKLTNTAGPDKFSAKLISFVWPSLKNKLNEVCIKDKPEYPTLDQGYIQRIIEKVKNPQIYKEFRPLGNLNCIPKYLFNKPIFKQIRDHISPIFNKRNNFSYTGTHLCIITTIDKTLELLQQKKQTILVKYDFSNAFGTIHHETMIHTLQGLNLSENTIKFLSDYMNNQRDTQTLVSDKTGIFYSNRTIMNRGVPQGQIGADLVFLMQQLVLREIPKIFRTLYMDDLNDLASGHSHTEAVDLALENEAVLVKQVKQIGFKLNDTKTEYAPFNVPKFALTDRGIKPDKVLHETSILGFPFLTKNTGIDVSPSCNMVIQRLNEKNRTSHAIRGYVSDIQTRVKLARSLVYQSIGELHMIVAYDSTISLFHKIKVKVNDILRATGLRKDTPQEVLDKVLGTNLKEFVEHSIIINGLKMHWKKPDFFDRSQGIRSRFAYDSYSGAFVELWNLLSRRDRKKILKLPNIKAIKRFLRKKRRKKYNIKIHTDYKWTNVYE